MRFTIHLNVNRLYSIHLHALRKINIFVTGLENLHTGILTLCSYGHVCVIHCCCC